ncbi:hypothetical protein KAW64_12700 [bacterium]|nr:hypothetical protein [bacterium]
MDLLRWAFTEGAPIVRHAHQDPDLEPLWDYPPSQRFLEPRDQIRSMSGGLEPAQLLHAQSTPLQPPLTYKKADRT